MLEISRSKIDAEVAIALENGDVTSSGYLLVAGPTVRAAQHRPSPPGAGSGGQADAAAVASQQGSSLLVTCVVSATA